MEYINISNLQLNNYKLSGVISTNHTYGVIGKNHDDVIKLLKILAGINDNNNTCFYRFKSIFDNKEYFKNRLYCDFSSQMVNTLDGKKIKEDLLNRYNVSFDEKTFKRVINNTNVRSEIVVTNEYKFSNLGTNLTSFAVFCGLEYPNVVVSNPLKYIDKHDKATRKEIINTICDKNKYNSVILDASDIADTISYLDYLIVLGDFDDAYIIDPNNDEFLISDDFLTLKRKLFKKGNIVISVNRYSKEEFKDFKKTVKHYKEVNFLEAYSYYTGEKYEVDNKK